MLMFTTCKIDESKQGFDRITKAFTENSEELNLIGVKINRRRRSLDSFVLNVSDDQAIDRLRTELSSERPALVYIHGFNNSFEDAFETCSKLEDQYKVTVIGFNWPGEGFPATGAAAGYNITNSDFTSNSLSDIIKSGKFIREVAIRYGIAKANAGFTSVALERFMRLVASVRMQAPNGRLSAGIHSLGNYLLSKSINSGQMRASLAAFDNIALLAPCVDTIGHINWLAQVRPRKKTYVTQNGTDSVLWAAETADGQKKLGKDIGDVLITDGTVRYVEFFPLAVGNFLAHSYFAEDIEISKKFFARLFRSENDLPRTDIEVDRRYKIIDNARAELAKWDDSKYEKPLARNVKKSAVRGHAKATGKSAKRIPTK